MFEVQCYTQNLYIYPCTVRLPKLSYIKRVKQFYSVLYIYIIYIYIYISDRMTFSRKRFKHGVPTRLMVVLEFLNVGIACWLKFITYKAWQTSFLWWLYWHSLHDNKISASSTSISTKTHVWKIPRLTAHRRPIRSFDGLTLIPTSQHEVITSIINCGMKLLIHSSTVQPLKFRNG